MIHHIFLSLCLSKESGIILKVTLTSNSSPIGQATGDVLLNGAPIDTGQMIRISGFVPQMDLAVESLTVQEHMEFMVGLIKRS